MLNHDLKMLTVSSSRDKVVRLKKSQPLEMVWLLYCVFLVLYVSTIYLICKARVTSSDVISALCKSIEAVSTFKSLISPPTSFAAVCDFNSFQQAGTFNAAPFRNFSDLFVRTNSETSLICVSN